MKITPYSLLHHIRKWLAPLRASIKYKLFFTFLITISAPVLVLGLISYQRSAFNVENDYVLFKSQLIEQTSSMLDEDIQTIIQQTMMLYNLKLDDFITVLNTSPERIDHTYMESYSMVDSYFSSVLQTNNKIDGITLVSLDGQIKYHVDRQFGDFSLSNFADTGWFQQALQLKGMPLLRGPYHNELVNSKHVSPSPVISITRTLLNLHESSNSPFGIVVMDYNVDRLQKSLIKLARTADTELLLVIGNSGEVLFNSASSSAGLPPDLLSAMMADKQGSFKHMFEEEMHLVTYFQSERTNWRVISLLPVSVLKEKSQFLKNIMLSLLAILLVLIFLLSYFTSLFITSPLKRLMKYFRAFQKGNFDTQITVKSQDELGQIGQTFNSMVINIRTLIKEKYTMKLLHQQSELKALQNQINPHFLHNTLTSIKEVIHNGQPLYAETMIQHLSDLFRYNLSKAEPIICFSEELSYMRKYIEIQECRFPDRFRVHYDVDDDVGNCAILRLTLQPLIENALLHGLYNQRGQAGEISVIAKLFQESLYIYIQDNGVGIPYERLEHLNHCLARDPSTLTEEEWEGLGILNVNARIKYYFGENYGLQLASEAGAGTTVKITLPAQYVQTRGSLAAQQPF